MVAVSSWGKLNKWEHEVRHLSDRRKISAQIQQDFSRDSYGIAHGMGRSYGDICLNPNGLLWKTAGLDRLIEFDDQSGILSCEAGVLLGDIQKLFVSRGWMLPVTPGTQFVTVGGAIANDVHGKNHHIYGSFGDHIKQLTLHRSNGDVIECGPTHQAEWFSATVGGLGLTGVISKAEIQLRRVDGAWLNVETIPYTTLDEFFDLSDNSEADWEYTVSWLDCISGKRGLFMRANHCDEKKPEPPHKRKLCVPITPPISLVNKLTLNPFNTTYFSLKKRQTNAVITHYEAFFYPLDNILEWNRVYGPKGFYQYQCVIPRNIGLSTIQSMMDEISRAGEGSFLTVLKTFGERFSKGILGFPQAGVTLALDFPNKSEKTLALFQRLDAIVQEAKGKVYLAKDACISRDFFETSYPKFSEFSSYRDSGMSSAMSRRLMGS